MAKVLTDEELAELERIGRVDYDPEEVNVARFGELIDKLNELIQAQAERTQADLARSQAQLEVLASLQKQANQRGTKSPSVTIDMTPLQDLVRELIAERDRVGYEFEVMRDPVSGYMSKVVATPIEKTTH